MYSMRQNIIPEVQVVGGQGGIALDFFIFKN